MLDIFNLSRYLILYPLKKKGGDLGKEKKNWNLKEKMYIWKVNTLYTQILKMIIRQELHKKTWNWKTQGSLCFLQENHEP